MRKIKFVYCEVIKKIMLDFFQQKPIIELSDDLELTIMGLSHEIRMGLTLVDFQ
jgi:hypothetical protein